MTRGDEMIVLYKEDGTLLAAFRGARYQDGAIYIDSQKVADGIYCLWEEVPEQPISHLQDPEAGLLVGKITDLKRYSLTQKVLLIDRDTEQKTTDSIHAFAGPGEQIGILRDQIVHILNAFGIEPTPEFARLNEIALQAIAEGQVKKEVLNAQGDAITQ